jgi:hypothetical protein
LSLSTIRFAVAAAPAVADTHTWTDAAVANSFRQQQTILETPEFLRVGCLQ